MPKLQGFSAVKHIIVDKIEVGGDFIKTNIANAPTGDYTFTNADNGNKVILTTQSADMTLTLPAVANISSGWGVTFIVADITLAFDIHIDCSGTTFFSGNVPTNAIAGIAQPTNGPPDKTFDNRFTIDQSATPLIGDQFTVTYDGTFFVLGGIVTGPAAAYLVIAV
jgi:hypothetical protein